MRRLKSHEKLRYKHPTKKIVDVARKLELEERRVILKWEHHLEPPEQIEHRNLKRRNARLDGEQRAFAFKRHQTHRKNALLIHPPQRGYIERAIETDEV